LSSSPDERRAYIDWARGIAVLIMIEAHTLDAWTCAADRNSIAFRNLTILGGFAAPLFLWLAGVSVALAAERGLARGVDRPAAASRVVARGLEIFVLAFLFRLQAFIVSPGGSPLTLFRVDILNVMGPAIAGAALVWQITRGKAAAAALSGAAGLIALSTPLIREAGWVDALPTWIQWYLRPSGEHTTFTLFPWGGFVFAGTAVGVFVARARAQDEARTVWGVTASGIAMTALGFYTASRPPLFPSSSFWTSSPAYFVIRVGLMAMALGLLYACRGLPRLWSTPFTVLRRFGQRSLFVYWIHVELVYGYTTWLIHRHLPLWATAVAYCAFCSLMYWAISVRDRVVDQWRAGPVQRGGSQPASA
jgi:uncharacterized membrane protein